MFPQFNIHSTPLLILVAQGLLFAYLLLRRYSSQKESSDMIMGVILLIMAYHRITYTIGFMGWYDTFTNTKVNYFLFSLGLAMGPLIYLYVRTTLEGPFRLTRKDAWHFVPIVIYIEYRMFLLLYDVQQEGYSEGYEGHLLRSLHVAYVDPVITILEYSSQLVYYAFTIQMFVAYRHRIKQYFSNTTPVEFNWIRNFLVVYTFLFVYGYVTDFVDALIIDLDYVHRWWVHFFSAIAIVYLGVKAYYTNLRNLHDLTRDMSGDGSFPDGHITGINTRHLTKIQSFIEDDHAFLNPQLTLADVATSVGISVHEVSATINNGLGLNFNEWINRYRVDAVKQKLTDPANNHLSLVAIGYDCGFNSKATFNRVFKQVSGISPSSYRSTQQK